MRKDSSIRMRDYNLDLRGRDVVLLANRLGYQARALVARHVRDTICSYPIDVQAAMIETILGIVVNEANDLLRTPADVTVNSW